MVKIFLVTRFYETREIATMFVFFLEYQGCDSLDQEILESLDQFLQYITRKIARECRMAATKHEIGGPVFHEIHKFPTCGKGQDGHCNHTFIQILYNISDQLMNNTIVTLLGASF